MYQFNQIGLVEGNTFPFSENFEAVLNEHLRNSQFAYAFDFDGVLTVISKERQQLKALDGEAYASPEMFMKDTISPIGVMAINISWQKPIAIITNREATLQKVKASIKWLIDHGACMSNILLAMRSEGVPHTRAEFKHEVLAQLNVENFYLDDKLSTIKTIRQTCENTSAYYYSSEEYASTLLEIAINDTLVKTSTETTTL